MAVNPFAPSCRLAGCSQPGTRRGFCATHAHSADARRGLTADRRHKHLYDSARWRRLRQAILRAHPLCTCADCADSQRLVVSEVVHHRKAHHGDEALFFAVENLQALAKSCHDRITPAAHVATRGG